MTSLSQSDESYNKELEEYFKKQLIDDIDLNPYNNRCRPKRFKNSMIRQIGGDKWKYGLSILDKTDKIKDIIVNVKYNWENANIKSLNSELLSLWVFAILSVYEDNKLKRKFVTAYIDGDLAQQIYDKKVDNLTDILLRNRDCWLEATDENSIFKENVNN